MFVYFCSHIEQLGLKAPECPDNRRESHLYLPQSYPTSQSSPSRISQCPSNVHYSETTDRKISSISSLDQFDESTKEMTLNLHCSTSHGESPPKRETRGESKKSFHRNSTKRSSQSECTKGSFHGESSKHISQGEPTSKRPSFSQPCTTSLPPILRFDQQHHEQDRVSVHRQHSYDPPRSPIHLTRSESSRESMTSVSYHNLQSPVVHTSSQVSSSSTGHQIPIQDVDDCNSPVTPRHGLHSSMKTSGHRPAQRHASCIESTNYTPKHKQRLSVHGRVP